MKESVTYQAILREGRAEGGRTMLLRIASKRFGPPDDAITARLEAITEPERLEAIADRVLTARDWDDLLADTETIPIPASCDPVVRQNARRDRPVS